MEQLSWCQNYQTDTTVFILQLRDLWFYFYFRSAESDWLSRPDYPDKPIILTDVNSQVDMLVYEDERVDFLIVNELTESSFVKICVASGALRYTAWVEAE